jgi:hypothetical protein
LWLLSGHKSKEGFHGSISEKDWEKASSLSLEHQLFRRKGSGMVSESGKASLQEMLES